MKTKKKIIFFSIIILLLFFGGFYKYYEHKFNQNVNSADLYFFISGIKTSKNLPQNFYKTYEEINPKSIENDLIFSILT